VRVRPDQAVPADAGGVALAATDHCLLHDDDLLAELDPATTLGGHHGTEQDPAFAADDHVACDDRVGRHIRRRRDLWPPSLVLDEHWPSSLGWRQALGRTIAAVIGPVLLRAGWFARQPRPQDVPLARRASQHVAAAQTAA
jgi:hypothetical protein